MDKIILVQEWTQDKVYIAAPVNSNEQVLMKHFQGEEQSIQSINARNRAKRKARLAERDRQRNRPWEKRKDMSRLDRIKILKDRHGFWRWVCSCRLRQSSHTNTITQLRTSISVCNLHKLGSIYVLVR